MEKLRRVTKVIDIVVFTATTLAIAGVFYEGMTQEWYDWVGILVICMDYSFMPATICHLITDRKDNMVTSVFPDHYHYCSSHEVYRC